MAMALRKGVEYGLAAMRQLPDRFLKRERGRALQNALAAGAASRPLLGEIFVAVRRRDS